MFPQDVIIKKRDGFELTQADITYFVDGLMKGTFTDYQASSLLMAIFLNGMNPQETSYLTQQMLHSGRVMNFSHIKKPKVDKHSTGGVGDKTSIVLAPLAAACGLCVPMISGRGLGHTGGTLDKLQSMEGFKVHLELPYFQKMLEELGLSMIGQTSDIAPADKKLYALRDVTGTVESIPLICASIMSKKLAEGIDGLVLDVKVGKGAFMKDMERSRALATNLASIGKAMNKKVTCLITDMNQPLGTHIGNALEIKECIDILNGEGAKDTIELTIALVAHMLVVGFPTMSISEATTLAETKLKDGTAKAIFKKMVQAQGANPDVADHPEMLPQAAHLIPVIYQGEDAYIESIDALMVGKSAMVLGAGREHVEDIIDPAVGISGLLKIGQFIKKGQPLCQLHVNRTDRQSEAYAMVEKAFGFSRNPVAIPSLIKEII